MIPADDSPDAVRDRARIAYDTVADDYAEMLTDQLDTLPVERHVLALFAELVGPGAAVLDVGCGPGHVTAHLAASGVAASGLDLSSEMIRVARARHPDIAFGQGSMESLAASDLDGIVAWYSLIHLPPPERPATLRTFAQALRPDGVLLVGFQVGDERRHISEGYGHRVSLDAWRLDPAQIESELADAGFLVLARTVRTPIGSEATPQAFVLARRDVPVGESTRFPENPQVRRAGGP